MLRTTNRRVYDTSVEQRLQRVRTQREEVHSAYKRVAITECQAAGVTAMPFGDSALRYMRQACAPLRTLRSLGQAPA